MTIRGAESQGPFALPRASVIGVIALGLVLPSVGLWILWIAPVGGLSADRAAMAARDYADLWAAGRLASEQAFAALYDPARLTAFLRDNFGPGMPAQIWPYPPPALLLAAPMASLPLVPGFVCYTVAGLAALAWAVARGVGSRLAGAAILLSPAVADNALTGQNGALTAAAMLGGLSCIETRPRFAGMLLGLLVLKPQLGLIVPVGLVAGRHWRVLFSAGITASALAAASAVIFGQESWTGFALDARPEIAAYFEAPWTGSEAQRMFVSVFISMRSLGASLPAAYAAQAVTAALAAALVWNAWRHPVRGGHHHRIALTATAALAASPWTHGYDMPVLAIAIAIFLSAARPWQLPLLATAWIWPGALSLFPLPQTLPSLSLLSMLLVASQLSLAIAPEDGKKRVQCA